MHLFEKIPSLHLLQWDLSCFVTSQKWHVLKQVRMHPMAENRGHIAHDHFWFYILFYALFRDLTTTLDQDLTSVMVKSSPESAWSSDHILTKIRSSILGQGSECRNITLPIIIIFMTFSLDIFAWDATSDMNETAPVLADQDLNTCIHAGRHRVDIVATYTAWQTRGTHNFTVVSHRENLFRFTYFYRIGAIENITK